MLKIVIMFLLSIGISAKTLCSISTLKLFLPSNKIEVSKTKKYDFYSLSQSEKKKNLIKRLSKFEFDQNIIEKKMLNNQVVDYDYLSLSRINNQIIKDFRILLKEKGQKVSLKKRKNTIRGQHYEFFYLEFKPKKVEIKDSIFYKILKISRVFEVESVQFDFLDHHRFTSLGTFDMLSNALLIGNKSARYLLKNNKIDEIIRHELSHASFNRKRLNGVNSLYHPMYHATGDLTFNGKEGTYSDFISSEELYNHSRNIYWLKEDIDSLNSYHEVLIYVNNLKTWIGSAKVIAKEIRDISSVFIESIKEDFGSHQLVVKTKITTINGINYPALRYKSLKNDWTVTDFIPERADLHNSFIEFNNFLKKENISANSKLVPNNLKRKYKRLFEKIYKNQIIVLSRLLEKQTLLNDKANDVISFHKNLDQSYQIVLKLFRNYREENTTENMNILKDQLKIFKIDTANFAKLMQE